MSNSFKVVAVWIPNIGMFKKRRAPMQVSEILIGIEQFYTISIQTVLVRCVELFLLVNAKNRK